MEIAQIDGRRLYYTFIAGANNIIKNQIHLNKINVFPVKDGDTGTNMASTIRAVIDSISPHKSYKITADRIAESTLLNARGNSGIIFAQFLYGVSNETDNIQTITVTQFIESVKRSVRYVYDAVANPVEGTMLTVIKTWAEFMDTNKARFNDFNQLFVHSIEILEKELAETKSKLNVLKQSNVVDAGANAFVFFIEGIIDLIRSKNIKRVMQLRAEVEVFPEIEEQIPEEVDLRYCTEAMIKNVDLTQKQLSKLVQEYGNSVVVAGAEKTRRIHVHTNEPAKLFDDLQQHGTITFQKVDDMLRQSDSVYKRKWNIALVTDSACDLSQDLIDKYQIHMLPINLFFGENHYLDKTTMQPEQFYKRLKTDKHFPKTAQVNEVAFRNVYSHLASHYDAIIAVHLTGQFSGTFFSSQKAAEKISKEFQKPIAVLDSKNLSGALGLIVLRIAQEIERGESFDKIIQKAEQWITDSRIFVSVKTLKYMVRGGRVSPWKGLIARLLNVNPIVSMDENGKSLVFGKTYSQKSNMEKVINHVKDITQDRKIWNYIVLHANNEKGADWYTKELKQLTGKKPTSVVNISPVIGANAGLGAASIAFMYE
ncbi:MAG: DegV family EDD domain-containing protein [Bacteroidetes bacterium]|nr:DegV family EDD domain-containing protein [Bacteroidota bacterium]